MTKQEWLDKVKARLWESAAEVAEIESKLSCRVIDVRDFSFITGWWFWRKEHPVRLFDTDNFGTPCVLLHEGIYHVYPQDEEARRLMRSLPVEAITGGIEPLWGERNA